MPEVVVVVAAAKKKKSKTSPSQWSFRLLGVVLCAFFLLGVMTGLSQHGRTFALRLETIFKLSRRPGHSSIIPVGFPAGAANKPTVRRFAQGSTIALVQRDDGFYALDSDGSLRGPVAPQSQGDMPILSGAGAIAASSNQLVEYAGALVRAEAGLGAVISEMRVESDATATIFLERPRIGITFDIDRTAFELPRAAAVLGMWRGHEELIAALDLTTPGQAVMRMKPEAFAGDRRAPAVRTVALTDRRRPLRNQPEESARR